MSQTEETRSIHSFYKVNFTHELGKGSTARVVKGVRLVDSVEVAIKIVSRISLTERKCQLLVNEILSLNKLDHDHIVKLYDIFEDLQNTYIVMELVYGGELFDRIAKKVHYNECEARDLCCYILSALDHCHIHNVVHRDVKPENLLMQTPSTDVSIKLCDFGFSEIAPSDTLTGYLGTPIYMAPEIMAKAQSYGKAVDMWSFGVLVYIILCGYPPFYDADEKKLHAYITTAAFHFHEEHWGRVSGDAKSFIRQLLCLNPQSRMTAAEAMEHPWLKASMEKLRGNDITDALARLRDFNAKRKIRSAVHSIIAVKRFQKSVFDQNVHVPHLEESPHMSSSATENDEENHFDLHSQDDDALDQPILKNSKSPSSSSCSSTQMKSQSHQPNVGFGLDNQRINMTTFISRMSKPARKPTLSLIAAIEAIAPGSVLSSANPASRRSSGTALPITPASFSSTVDSVTPNNKLLIQQPSTSSVLMSKQPSASSPSKSRQQSHQQSTNQSSSIERPPRVDTSPPRIAIDVKPPAIYGGYLFKHGHFNYIRRYMVLEAGALKIYTDESKREFKNELLLYLYTLVIGNTVEEDNCASSKPSSGGGRYRNYSDDRGSSFSLSLTHQSFSTISGHIGTTTKQTSPLPKIYKTDLVLLGRVPTVSSVELQCLDTDALPKWVELLQQHIFYSMSTHHSAAAVKARTVSRQLRQSVESDSDVASQIDLPHYNTNTTEQMTQAISKFNQDFIRSGSGLFTEGGNKLPSFGTMSEKTGDGDEDEDEDTHNNRLIAERSKHSNHALEPPSSDVMNPILMGARRRFSLKNDGSVLNSDKTPVGSLDESISLFDYPPLTQGRVILRNAWWVFSSWTSRYIVLEMGILRIYKRKCTEYPFGEELDMEIPIYNCSVKSATFDSSQILMYIFLQSKNERSIFALPTRSITLKAISESFVDENNRYSGHMGHPTTSSQDWLKRFKQSMNFYNNSHQLRSIS